MVDCFSATLKLNYVACGISTVPELSVMHSARRAVVCTHHVQLAKGVKQSSTFVHAMEFRLWDLVHSIEKGIDFRAAYQFCVWFGTCLDECGRRTDVVEMTMSHEDKVCIGGDLLFELSGAVWIFEPRINIQNVFYFLMHRG